MIPASRATERASPDAFEIRVGVVEEENHLSWHAKLNVPDVAETIFPLIPSTSKSKSAEEKM